MTQIIGNNYPVKIPSLGDSASIVEAFELYHNGAIDGTSLDSMEQHLSDVNDRVTSTEASIASTNSTVASIQASIANLSSDFVKTQPASNNTNTTRNIIKPSLNTVIPLQVEGAAGQTANLQEWRLDGSTVRARVDSAGRFYSYDGTSTDEVVTLSGSQVLTNKAIVSPVSAVSSASYTLVLNDRSKFLQFTNNSAKTVTIPTNSTTAFAIGTTIGIANFSGSGNLTISPSSGVNLYAQDNFYSIYPYGSCTLIKTGTNDWYMIAGGGGSPKAVVSSSTAANVYPVTISGVDYNVYQFTGSGSITFSVPGLIDCLLIGPGGAYGVNGGSGGAGGFVSVDKMYVTSGSYPIVVGGGYGGPTVDSYITGQSTIFNGVSAICGGSGSAYFDRSANSGASGGGGGSLDSRTNLGGDSSHFIATRGFYGIEGQGTIGANKRGGNGANGGTGGGGGAGGDASGSSGGAGVVSNYTGSNVTYCVGGTYGQGSGSANLGNGSGAASGSSGTVFIRVRV